jgi:hypothetical protein
MHAASPSHECVQGTQQVGTICKRISGDRAGHSPVGINITQHGACIDSFFLLRSATADLIDENAKQNRAMRGAIACG